MEKQQIKQETLYFVEALKSILKAEESMYEGLTEIYGEEGGEKRWYKSSVYNALEAAKKEVKIQIGDTLELIFTGLLEVENKENKED